MLVEINEGELEEHYWLIAAMMRLSERNGKMPPKDQPCRTCGGSGRVKGKLGTKKMCPECLGTGVATDHHKR